MENLHRPSSKYSLHQNHRVNRAKTQLNKQEHQLIRLFQLHNKWGFKKKKTSYQVKLIGRRSQLTYSAVFLSLLLCLSTGVRSQNTVPPPPPTDAEITEALREKPPARLDPENASGEKDHYW